ncbi:hypothetical protein JXA31_00795 [Candidatus Bathyarchaeota archaeon]|nr:hypothetical protein [Candidatus Bathyarchaeota archaeon]
MNKKSPLSAFFSLFLSFVLLAFCLVVPVHAELVWDIQVVDEDCSSIGNGYCPIIVDADNNSHIAYSGAPELRYASWNDSGWNIQQMPTYAFAHDLALDADGNSHVTFGSLAYASWTGTSWDIQTVTTNHTVYSSLALDSSGNPHVAYSIGSELKYASQNGSNWNIQTVDTLPEINFEVSLALDSNDTPYIMYSSPSSYVDNIGIATRSENVMLAVWKNSSWNIDPVLASSNFTEFGNMVLDSNDRPHFLATQGRFDSYENTHFLSDILYVCWDGVAWNTQIVALNVTLANMGFLALGPDDYPHIVYKSGQLMYARWTGKTWETQNVTKTRMTSGLPTLYLAVDSNGNPHISYLEDRPIAPYNRRNLIYATANVTKPPEDAPTFPDAPLLIVSTAIIIGTVIAVTAYVWKKKHKH